MRRSLAVAALAALLASVVFGLATVGVEDTDAWMHLALGRGIVAARALPATEEMNFPIAGTPYYNPEWLFGVVLALLHAGGGVAALVLLKAAVVTVAFLVMLREALSPPDAPERRLLGAALAVIALAGTLLAVRHRFVERPDIVLMVFLALTVHALTRYREDGSRRLLYALPALQLVWVNMHPSVVVGIVPFVAVLAGGLADRAWDRYRGVARPATPTARQLGVVAAVFAGVLGASLVNPYGIDPFLAPFRMVSSAWFRHEIMELQAPRLGQETTPFVLVALLVLAFASAALRRRLDVASVLLVAPFVYLGLSGRRFIFLLAVVAGPVLAREARALAARLPGRALPRVAPASAALAVAVLAGVVVLAALRIEPLNEPRKVPGFGVNIDTVPEAALAYLDRAGVDGRVFNTFHWGGYMLWRDYPRRVPFVDGRGLLPPALLDELMVARTTHRHLERLRQAYGFEAIVVDYPIDGGTLRDEAPAADFALASPDWALVYWDDLALVYLRRAGPHAARVARDEYRLVRPANGALALRRALGAGVPATAIEAELVRNVEDTGSSMALALLGFLHNETGAHDKAIATLSRVRDFPFGSNLYNAYQGLAYAHARQGDAARAIAYYRKAARLGADPDLLLNIGLASAKAGRLPDAVDYLERAVAAEPSLAAAYPPLIAASRAVGRRERVAELEAQYPRVVARQQAEAHFRRGVREYLDGHAEAAIAAFQESLRLNPASAPAHSNLGYVYFDLGRLDEARQEQQRALEARADFANAHYGLALIHERRGEREDARRHFAEYLRLDPTGYWARKSDEALRRLAGR